MPIELILIIFLVLALSIGIRFQINIGVVCLAIAFGTGLFLLDLNAHDIFHGFPVELFVVLFGLTYFLGATTENGTINWLLSKLTKLIGGNAIYIPWAFFAISLVSSTFGIFLAPLLLVVGAQVSSRLGCNPFLLGAMIIHGSQPGLFSPIAPYGVLFQTMLSDYQDIFDPIVMFGIIVALHIPVAITAFVLFGGRQLAGKTFDHASIDADSSNEGGLTHTIAITLLSFIALIVAVLVFKLNIGVVALALGFGLAMLAPKGERDKPLNHVPWSILVIIVGVLTYVHVMEKAGAITWLADYVRTIGSPNSVVLVLSFLSSALTALTSTFGTFGILIPLSEPFVAAGDISPTMTLAAIAVSAAVTDISPFSTMGALFLATTNNADRGKLLQQMLRYVIIMTLTVPLVVWVLLILPGW